MAGVLAPLRALVTPSRLIFGVAGVAAVANAIALAAPAVDSGKGDSGRLGASLQDASVQRDRVLAAERRKLEMREQAVKAGESRLAGQAQQNQAAAAAPTGGKNGAPEPEVPYDNLARIYQTMKPQRAAPIFEKLDIEVQAQVARRMRERATAQIMAYMTPSSAVELSMALAGRKVIKAPPAPLPQAKRGKAQALAATAKPAPGKPAGAKPAAAPAATPAQ
ncbi:flagellar motility protein MotE (MotC chaperone) [Novosphingobium sp. PhB55]|jgi:flagellar motility protein MotE (MotC chaperone)|nr:flagellar motility protein MotE (MotC chaperone) [Novosphingobium sp. PhB55]